MAGNDILILLGLGYLLFKSKGTTKPAPTYLPTYVSPTGATFIAGSGILQDEEGYTSPEADIEPIDYVERTRFRDRSGQSRAVNGNGITIPVGAGDLDRFITAIIPQPSLADYTVEQYREKTYASVPKTISAEYTVEEYREARR